MPDGTYLRQPGHLGVDVEETRDAPRGGCVQDDRVVDEVAARVPSPSRLVDLAGEQHVAQPRRNRGGEIDDPEAV